MTVGDLLNMFLRLEMAAKEKNSEFVFDTGRDDEAPFAITGVSLDEDGDVCLENDSCSQFTLDASSLATELGKYDRSKTVYFMSIDSDGEHTLYNIKDGGTKDRWSQEIKMITVRDLAERLRGFSSGSIPYFESGTINFTINAIYMDKYDYLCLESNEIEELDNYTTGLILEELNLVNTDTPVYLFNQEAGEYYGFYPDEFKVDSEGNPWINVR